MDESVFTGEKRAFEGAYAAALQLERTGKAAFVLSLLAALTFTLAPAGRLFAQRTAVDSLQRELARAKDAFGRADALSALAREIGGRDRARSCPLAEAALETAASVGYKAGMARARVELGWCSFFDKQFDAAGIYFSEAAKNADAAKERETLARALVGSAWVARRRERESDVLPAMRRALDASYYTLNATTSLMVLGQIRSIYRSKGQDSLVIGLHKDFLAVSERRKDTAGVVAALAAIGSIQFQASAWIQSLASFERCVELCIGSETPRELLSSLLHIGNIQVNLGDPVTAMKTFQRGLKAAEAAGNTRYQALFYSSVARLHTMRGDFDQSLALHHRCLELLEKGEDTSAIAMHLVGLGIEYDFAGRKDEALPHLERAVNLWKLIGRRDKVTTTLEIMGAICTNKGDYTRATSYLEQASAMADSIGDPALKALVLHGIGRNYRDRGDLAAALNYSERSLSFYRTAKDMKSEEFMLRSIGTLHSRLGGFASAIAYLDSARDLANLLGGKGRVREAERSLSEHYARSGDYRKALALLRKVDAMADSMYNEENYRQINELNAIHETGRKEKLIALLEKENKISEMELRRRDDELRRRRMLAAQHEQEMLLLEKEQAIDELLIERSNSGLALSASLLSLGKAETEKTRRELELQKQGTERGTMIRNMVLLACLLILSGAGFSLRSLRDKKRAALLHAENAEYRAREAELQAHKVRIESDMREKAMREAFSSRLLGSQEHERKRIAASLHDGIGQELLIIKNRAAMALDDEQTDAGNLTEILSIAAESLDEVRRMSRDLRPIQLERSGLTATLRSMLSAVAENSGLHIDARIDDVDGLIEADREIDLYRVMQEALNNIVRHAEAASAEVGLRRENGALRLTVRDDGKGFDPLLKTAAGDRLGLQGMRERVQMLGGSLEIISAPGKGTELRAVMPIACQVGSGV